MSPCEYACALLERDDGALLFETRPPTAKRAAGTLTCFGGKCEAGENSLQTLCRELDEELAWQPIPSDFQFAIALRKGDRHIADFYTYHGPLPKVFTHQEQGRQAIWIPQQALPATPISPWHQTTITAWQASKTVIDLNTLD